MNQDLNLLPHLARTAPDWLDGRRLLLGAAAALVLGVALVLLSWFDYRASSNRLAIAEARLAGIRAEAQALETEQAGLGSPEQLQGEVVKLRAQLAGKRELLGQIGALSAGEHSGFSGYLESLARQSNSALWFTRIEIQGGGALLTLGGQAREARAVPQHLQALRQESAFSGREFSMLHIAEGDTKTGNGALNFEIRSSRTEARP